MSQLNDEFQLPYIPDLMARKLAGPEQSELDEADMPFYQSERDRLSHELVETAQTTFLPEYAQSRDELNDLLVSVRLSTQETG